MLWHGRPAGDFVTRIGWDDHTMSGVFFLAIGVLSAGAALFEEYHAQEVFILAAISAVLGLYILVGHDLWTRYSLRRTWYMVSTRRAFIASAIFYRLRVKEWRITATTEIELVESTLASVKFSTRWDTVYSADEDQFPNPGNRPTILALRMHAFCQISDAPIVFALIQRVRSGEFGANEFGDGADNAQTGDQQT